MFDSNLPIFISVAESGSFSQAALHLGKSPQAVFKQITTFEERLGVKLFDRSPAGMRLTPAGKSIYKDAKYLLSFSKESIKRAKKIEKNEGNLNLLALYNESAAEFGIEPFGPYHPGGCSDASYLAKAGIPILDSLGPEGDHAHTMQEYAVLDSLFTRTAMLVRTILKLTDVTL